MSSKTYFQFSTRVILILQNIFSLLNPDVFSNEWQKKETNWSFLLLNGEQKQVNKILLHKSAFLYLYARLRKINVHQFIKESETDIIYCSHCHYDRTRKFYEQFLRHSKNPQMHKWQWWDELWCDVWVHFDATFRWHGSHYERKILYCIWVMTIVLPKMTRDRQKRSI
jgi:hypothetical protein